MEVLIEEINQEIEVIMQSNIGLLGWKINCGYQNVGQKLDIIDLCNVQAWEELYQKKFWEQGYVKGYRKQWIGYYGINGVNIFNFCYFQENKYRINFIFVFVFILDDLIRSVKVW